MSKLIDIDYFLVHCFMVSIIFAVRIGAINR